MVGIVENAILSKKALTNEIKRCELVKISIRLAD